MRSPSWPERPWHGSQWRVLLGMCLSVPHRGSWPLQQILCMKPLQNQWCCSGLCEAPGECQQWGSSRRYPLEEDNRKESLFLLGLTTLRP